MGKSPEQETRQTDPEVIARLVEEINRLRSKNEPSSTTRTEILRLRRVLAGALVGQRTDP